MKTRLNTWLLSQQQATLRLIALLLVGVVWMIDYVTGPDISTSIFYLVPVAFAAWWIDRRTGMFISLTSALAWLLTDIMTSPTPPNHLLIPYWNAAVRLGFFLIVTLALSSLQQAKRRQEDLVAFMVHDLRAPLGNALTSFSLLQEMIAWDDRELQRLIEIGLSSGNRLLIQIDALLDLARLENGKLLMAKKVVTVTDLMAQAVQQVSLLADFKQIEILVDAPQMETAVWADPGLTERILVNLLTNAIKFSPEESTMLVQIKPEGKMVNFCIHNEGPGISHLWQTRIFHKFEQVRAREAGVAVGYGLGLAFCKLAVEAQNGRIWLDVPQQPGTTICFSLTLAAEKGAV